MLFHHVATKISLNKYNFFRLTTKRGCGSENEVSVREFEMKTGSSPGTKISLNKKYFFVYQPIAGVLDREIEEFLK